MIPFPGWIGIGGTGASGGTLPDLPAAPAAVTGADEAKPVTPNLAYRGSKATTVTGLQRDLNALALSASQAATENEHWVMRQHRQILVLSTSGTTTDSAVEMLHADSLISHVTLRVTVAITGDVTSLNVGDSSDPDRFVAGFSDFSAGDSAVGLAQWGNGTPHQSSDAKLRLTADDTVTAGAVEVIVWYYQFRVPDLPVDVAATPAPPSGGTGTTGLGLLTLWGIE